MKFPSLSWWVKESQQYTRAVFLLINYNRHYEEIAKYLKGIIHIVTSTVGKINRKVDKFDEAHLVYLHQRCGPYFFFSQTQLFNTGQQWWHETQQTQGPCSCFNRSTEMFYVILYKKIARHCRMWQRAYGFFGSTFVCKAMQRKIYIILIPTLVWNNGNIHMCNWEILKPKEDDYMVVLSHLLKMFITFKIFSVLNIVPIYNQMRLEGV